MVAHVILYVAIAGSILAPVVGLTWPHVRSRLLPAQQQNCRSH